VIGQAGSFTKLVPTLVGGFLLAMSVDDLANAHPSLSRAQGVLATQLDNIALNAEAEGFNGSVYITIKGKTVLDKAYGWTAPDRLSRVNTDTLFNIASVSKAITATAILKLVEARRLDVDWRIDRIFPNVPADKAAITVEELLVHTSCLPDQYLANGRTSRDDAVAAVLNVPLLCQPGSKFHYSDDGYALLAAIIERVSGKQFGEFVRREVFDPAGMKDTRFWDEADDRTSRNVARIVTLPLDDRFRGLNWGYIGSGGIWSNAEELARFFVALEVGKIVTKESVAELLKSRVKVSVGAAGYGWYIGHSSKGTPLVFARGNEDWGHSALIFWYPDRRILLTIVTNSGFDHGTPVSRVLAKSFEDILLSLPKPEQFHQPH
jgi:CubicO group peptidase (beta-lactamase class C family)